MKFRIPPTLSPNSKHVHHLRFYQAVYIIVALENTELEV